MNINIQLDLNQPISLLQDYARGLAYLRLDDESQKVDEIIGAKRMAEIQAVIDADPKRTIYSGIWRDRGGKIHEVTTNDTGHGDGLPWLVDNCYTVDNHGYAYPGNHSAYDLMELVV